MDAWGSSLVWSCWSTLSTVPFPSISRQRDHTAKAVNYVGNQNHLVELLQYKFSVNSSTMDFAKKNWKSDQCAASILCLQNAKHHARTQGVGVDWDGVDIAASQNTLTVLLVVFNHRTCSSFVSFFLFVTLLLLLLLW